MKDINIGYGMITKLITSLEEEDTYNFDYEPGDIVDSLFNDSSKPIFESGFLDRMHSDHKFAGNQLFTQMRKSITELKQR